MEVEKKMTSIFYFKKYLEEIIMETYEEFINNILETRGRFACGEEYHERHHIKPKCMGGTDDKDNLIDLFAREHFEAHRLLVLENPNNAKLVYAWWMMSHMSEAHKRDYELTAEEYEEAKKAFSKSISGENHPMYGVHRFGEAAPMYGKRGKNNPNYGSHRTEEQKKRLSEAKLGEKNPNYGLTGEKSPLFGISPLVHMNDQDYVLFRQRLFERMSGANNPKARKVIRLSDCKIYGYLDEAAQDNGVCRVTIRNYCKKHKGFMYYDEWIAEQNANI